MTTISAAQPTTEAQYIEDLIARGHFIPSGEPGIYGRGVIFEQVRNGFCALVSRIAAPVRSDAPRFPPNKPHQTHKKTKKNKKQTPKKNPKKQPQTAGSAAY